MKLLIDVNLSPRWVAVFAKGGLDAIHWSSLGPGNTSDSAIFSYAAEYGYVIFTNDLDFGILLAATNASAPSVIQLRVDDAKPEVASPIVMEAIAKTALQLDNGALVTIQEQRIRVAPLPL